uniref:Secreted protein n=1 Tax=Achlya hypogyna TaxID=1202772 RepID=A0A0A7CN67_ACHHY|nr:secreted protein [Achlya hypogyna]
MRFFFALLATALAAKSSSAPVVIQPTSVKWALTFEDNFNTLNLSTWRLSHDCSTNNGCVHNNELQVYLANQVSVKSGNLVIEATNAPYTSAAAGTRQFRSGRIDSLGRFAQQYGRFEARIKLPSGRGVWPAFWYKKYSVEV